MLQRALRTHDLPSLLYHLREHDPLRLYERCARHVRRRHHLLDVDRVHAVLVEHLARWMLSHVRSPGDDELTELSRGAIETVLEEDRAAEREGRPFAPDDARFAFLLESYVLDARELRSASVAFNDLPARTRKAFFLVLVELREVRCVLASGGWSRRQLRDDLLRALEALRHIDSVERKRLAALPPRYEVEPAASSA